MQLFEAQSTGFWRQRPPAKTGARWRCGVLIKNMTAHYNIPFCVSLTRMNQAPINLSKWGLNIPIPIQMNKDANVPSHQVTKVTKLQCYQVPKLENYHIIRLPCYHITILQVTKFPSY